MDQHGPRWRRRKDARPAEIAAAALEVFAAQGYAAAKLDDIARKAGVVKGSIYRHFATKEELFREVVRSAIVPNLEAVRAIADVADEPFARLAPRLLAGAASLLGRQAIFGVARMVIAESRNFPDLARIWHDEVVAPVIETLAQATTRAQTAGEVRDGDPRLFAFSLMGPLLMAALFCDVFAEVTADSPDLARLAEQHGRTVLHGVLAAPKTEA